MEIIIFGNKYTKCILFFLYIYIKEKFYRKIYYVIYYFEFRLNVIIWIIRCFFLVDVFVLGECEISIII